MKALRKIGIIAAAVAIMAIGIGCQNTVEVEKEKTYASAVTFKAEDVGEAGVKITMTTATEDATIFYTTDGTTPTATSNKYSAPLTFNMNAEIRAVAIKDGIEKSPISVGKVPIKTKPVEVDKKADETAPAAVTNLAASAKGGFSLHGQMPQTATYTATK